MNKASTGMCIARPLAVLATLACTAAGVQAQTSVSVYGRIVAGINYQSNQPTDAGGRGNQWRLDGNEWGTSMLGFRGNEDLGGGLKALFTLENGFDASNGKVNGGSGLWTRRAFVGFNGSAGTIKLGKDLAVPSDAVWAIDPTGQQAMSTATLVKQRNWPITSNMISYETPSLGGFSTTLMHGFGEAAGSFTRGPAGASNGSRDTISLAYLQPAYELRAIYDVQRDANGRFSDLYNNSRVLTLGGTATIDRLKLYAGYQDLRASAAAAGQPDRARHYWLGANYQITPALTLIGAAYRINANADVGSANLFVAGGNYNLSRRTLLYASVGTVRNNANSDFSVEYGDTGGIRGQSQMAFYTGISHSF